MGTSDEHNALRAEALRALLAPDSPARRLPEFADLFTQLDELEQRKQDLRSREKAYSSELPGLDKAERAVAEAEKNLSQERAALSAFAGELGKAAFAGLRAGELPDRPAFADRKDLQARIDALEQRRTSLSAGDRAGLIERAKVQAQLLTLAGQLKLEEFRIGPANKALGSALMASRDLTAVRCASTEQILRAIGQKNKEVAAHAAALKEATTHLAKRNQEAGKALGQSSPIGADAIRAEVAATRKEIAACENKKTSVRQELLKKALASDQLRKSIPSLSQLERVPATAPRASDALRQIGDRVVERVSTHRLRHLLWYAAGGAALYFLLYAGIATRSIKPDAAATAPHEVGTPPASGSTTANSTEHRDHEKALEALRAAGATVKRLDDGSYTVYLKYAKHPTASDLDALESIGPVSVLDLSASSVSTSDLKRIGRLSSLRQLFLTKTKTTDEGVASLTGLQSLELLRLDFTAITDKALAHVAQLKKLTELTLSGTKITDDGLQQLKKLGNLASLGIATTPTRRPGVYFANGKPSIQELFEERGNSIIEALAADYFCSRVLNRQTLDAFLKEFPEAVEVANTGRVREYKTTEFFRFVFLDERLGSILSQGSSRAKFVASPDTYRKLLGPPHAGLEDGKIRGMPHKEINGKPTSAHVWYLREQDLGIWIWRYANGFQIAEIGLLSVLKEAFGEQ